MANEEKDRAKVKAKYSKFYGKIGDVVGRSIDPNGIARVLIQFPNSEVPHLFREEEVEKVKT